MRNMFGNPSRFAVVLHGYGDSIVIGPFATREEAVSHAVFLIKRDGIDPAIEEALAESVSANGRNDVTIATMATPRDQIVRAS